MKKSTVFGIISILVIQMVLSVKAYSQLDTLDIPLEEGNQTSKLKEIIDGDSLDRHDVYRLERGGYYWVTGIIENNYPLTIVGREEPADLRPPVLIYKTDLQGAAPDHMILAHDDVVIKNLYIAGIDELENHHNFYLTTDDSLRLVVDNCVFNYSALWESIFGFRSTGGDIIITNSMFFNLMQDDGYQWSRLLFTRGNKIDSIIFRNNTVFNNAAAVIDCENRFADKAPSYMLIEHNTILNTGLTVLHDEYAPNLVYRNNIEYNTLIRGDAIQGIHIIRDFWDQDDHTPFAFVTIDTIQPEVSPSLYDSLLNYAGVPYPTVKVYNNSYFQSEEIIAYLEAMPDDSALVPQVLDERSKGLFDDDANWPGLYWSDETNWYLDPNFTNNPTDNDKLVVWAKIQYIVRGGGGVNFLWIPGSGKLDLVWPLTDYIDLTYSNSTLVSSEGLHMGDLYHWYPDEYQNWISDIRDTEVKQPVSFSLKQNYPNPFNPTTTIKYSIDKTGIVKLNVYNVLGKKVRTIVNGKKSAGIYSVLWDGTDDNGNKVASGIYFCNLEMKNQKITSKMILLK